MIREIVRDTNVLVAAFRSKRGASYELVRSLGQADWRLNVSVALALEYEDVLKRKDMIRGISEKAIDGFLDYLFSISNLVPFVLRQRPHSIFSLKNEPGGGSEATAARVLLS